MELVKIKLTDLIPYENNPRFNDEAVEAVKESIRQCGYCAPIVVDEDYVILAGHTRHKALYQLGYTEAECVVKRNMTEEQKRKYRLLDNKTAELSEWDTEALILELDGLDFGDLSLFEKEMEKATKDVLKEHTTVDEEDKIVICPRCGKPITGFIENLEVDYEG